MSPVNLWPSALLLIGLVFQRAASQGGIDEMIMAASESVDEFDRLADIEGNTIRQELDMMLTKEQAQALGALEDIGANDDPNSIRKRRKAIKSLSYRWTDKTIPYTIASGVFDQNDRSQINSAIEEWRKYTCINFKPASRDDRNKVHFDNGRGCYSYVGMIRSGSQKIGLAKGCRFKGVVVHEIGHAVGFHHEQNRPDRDDHVRIIRQNIPEKLYYNFKKYPTSAVDTMGVPYDYGSVMHYGGKAFSNNGQYTIKTIDPMDQRKIGNRKGLSYYDIMLANKMYKCSENCRDGVVCPRGAFKDKTCKCMCPGDPIKECTTSGGTIPPTTRGPTRATEAPKCGDKNKYCSSWAKAGYCSRNTYVKMYCRKSCGFCGGDKPEPACKDMKVHCTAWGQQGFCQKDFEVFMSENCPKTCKICGATGAGEQGGKDDNSASTGSCSLVAAIVYSLFVFVRKLS